MLLFSESKTKSSPLGDASTEYGSIPILLPSNTVSTVYPSSNFIIERLEDTAENWTHELHQLQHFRKQSKFHINNIEMGKRTGNASERSIPFLVVDFRDHSHLTRADTTLETTPLIISANMWGWKKKTELKANDRFEAEHVKNTKENVRKEWACHTHLPEEVWPKLRKTHQTKQQEWEAKQYNSSSLLFFPPVEHQRAKCSNAKIMKVLNFVGNPLK